MACVVVACRSRNNCAPSSSSFYLALVMMIVVTMINSLSILGYTSMFPPFRKPPLVMSSRYRRQYDTFLLFSRRRNQSRKIHDDDDDEYDDDNDPRIQKEIPQLPPASSSSSSRDRTDNDSIINLQDNSSTIVGAVQLNRKLQLQYTCNVCETRNIHSISRIAYTSGVVIARCKGCDSQHIIADHLGWTDYKGGFEGPNINTIEDYFSNERKPKVDDETDSEVVNDTNDANANSVVNRVTQEVFELEKMLRQYDMKSGSIIGDDGKLAME